MSQWAGAGVRTGNSGNDKTLKLIFQPDYAQYFIAGIAIYLMHRFGPTMLTWGIVTGCFLIIIALALGWFNWVRGRWIITLGAMTYPIYLIHHAIGVTVIRELSPTISPKPLLIGTTLLMMLIAWLIHRCVERPLVPFLKRGLSKAVAEMNSHGDQLRKREHTEPSDPERARSRHPS